MLARAVQWLFRECFQELDLERKSALTAFSWGVWVISLHSFGSSPGFAYLILAARWLTGPTHAEWFWGLLSIAGGTSQLYGVFTNRRRLRMVVALYAATLWSCLSVAFWLHNPVGGAPLVYGFFAWSNAALYYQVASNRRGARGRFNVRMPFPAGGAQP